MPWRNDPNSDPGYTPYTAPDDPNDYGSPPPYAPAPGHQWTLVPNPRGYGDKYIWEQVSIPQWTQGGGGSAGPTAEELAVDYARIEAEKRGQDLDFQAATRGYDIEEMLGLKNVDIDWAKVGVDRQRAAIDKERQLTERQQLSEQIRADKEREAEDRKQRALDAASQAVDAYLRGSQLADARRLAAFQEQRALLPSMVDPNQRYAPGQEPGGAMATMAQRYNLPFAGTEIQHQVMNPGALAAPPSPEQIGNMQGMTALQQSGMG